MSSRVASDSDPGEAMLTLDLMNQIELTSRPLGQITTGWALRANYRLPFARTKIVLEGLENLPDSGRVYIAMNHTDRYNYWPFQVELWRRRDAFTATWVKGKYFNNEWLGRFLVAANNIPAPSKGYVITVDAAEALGHAPAPELYRLIREALDEGRPFEDVQSDAQSLGFGDDIRRLDDTPRDILGYRYDPATEDFLSALRRLFHQMMQRFVELNYDAFDKGLKVLVFPEGTRSRRLGEGKPGLAQMAVRTRAQVVPVGCNGSDDIYPGNSPVARGGTVVYRIGEPLTPEGELAPFQIDDEYQPFTAEAAQHARTFEGFTQLVMSRIEQLLDPRYRSAPDAAPEVDGAKRFL